MRKLCWQVLGWFLWSGLMLASSMAASFDPDAPPETSTMLAPFLSFGGQLELVYEFHHNPTLSRHVQDNSSRFIPELSLALTLHPNRYFQAFVDITLSGDFVLLDKQPDEQQVSFEVKEAFVLFKNLLEKRLTLQLGRQRFDDDREWLYDAELDAAKAIVTLDDLTLELSVSRERLLDKDVLNRDHIPPVNNYLAYGNYKVEDVDFAAYVMFRDERSHTRRQDDLWFLGLRSEGDLSNSVEYWLELAHVRGKTATRTVSGFGTDLGVFYKFLVPLQPSLVFAYAFGTGDSNPKGRTDSNFRQTGLHDNKSELNGVRDFKYYGELLDPELSNLSIFTAGIGLKPSDKSSIDLLYHYYLQHQASSELRGVRLDSRPDGRSKRLGSEIDLIFGYAEIRHIDLALALGYFIPDKAFPNPSAHSFFIRLEMQWTF